MQAIFIKILTGRELMASIIQSLYSANYRGWDICVLTLLILKLRFAGMHHKYQGADDS